MSCCLIGTAGAVQIVESSAGPSPDEVMLASRRLGDGLMQTDLSVPGVNCGRCIQTIENALSKLDGVVHARVNLSTHRVTIKWREGNLPPIVETLSKIGYPAHLFDEKAGKDEALAELIRAVAIAGFGSGNVMLLSVAVWSGATDATRDLFHWLSALIAIPVLAFSGRIFFRSAWNALRHGRMNMDVPISIGVLLAYGLSIYETIHHGQHAYFDASICLLFFLLIGRTLDHVMRQRARTAVAGLARLAPRGAMVLRPDGSRDYLPLAEIEPGMEVLISAGERIPVDGVVIKGASDIDCSMATGESEPQVVSPGTTIRAGMLNLTRPITIRAIAAANESFLAEMVRLMEAAEGGRARYRRLADRASALYAPVVHLTALFTFIVWMMIDGDWHQAITIAIAVLIITCPCALGLAVPIVQVVAARRLFENGIMVKDGAAMERLATIDTAVFDKTGTLTTGQIALINAPEIDGQAFQYAAQLAAHSRHPVSQAIVAAASRQEGPVTTFENVEEIPGYGLEARANGSRWRLGRASWAIGDDQAEGTVLTRDGQMLAAFRFRDTVRRGAKEAVRELRAQGIGVEILSGDGRRPVEEIAAQLNIENVHAELLPGDKTEHLRVLADRGHKVLMVGDGLNDAPALAAAHVAMAPASAADIGRNAADFVFLRESLNAVPIALKISRRAGRLIRQNFGLAIVYNMIAIPIAVLGYVTPLVAAIAMSVSSILVISNALRLENPAKKDQRKPEQQGVGVVEAA